MVLSFHFLSLVYLFNYNLLTKMPVTVAKWIFLTWKPIGKMATKASDKSHR